MLKREQPTKDIMTGQSMLKFLQNFLFLKSLNFFFADVAFNSNEIIQFKADIVMMGDIQKTGDICGKTKSNVAVSNEANN